VRTALVGLERERERLERDLAAAQSRDVTCPGGIEEIVNELVARQPLRGLESGEAEERKAVVRTFLRGVTINRKAGQATLTWFRLPAIQNVGLKVGGAEGSRTPDPKTASLVLSQLSYSPTRRITLQGARTPCQDLRLVPGAGVEPARPYGHWILSPAWLPLHHPGPILATAPP